MTRMANLGDFAGNSARSTPSFAPATFNSTRVGSNAGAAADASPITGVYNALRTKAPQMDQIVATATELRSSVDMAAEKAKAALAGAGISGVGAAMRGKMQADAMGEQASAAKKGGAFSMFASIAGAGLGLLSDEDTKHTVERIENACQKLRELRPVTFYYKEEYSEQPQRMHHGFIAQEYQKVMPDATYYDESIGKLCIDTNDLIGLLVKANQELQERVTLLEVKNVLISV